MCSRILTSPKCFVPLIPLSGSCSMKMSNQPSFLVGRKFVFFHIVTTVADKGNKQDYGKTFCKLELCAVTGAWA